VPLFSSANCWAAVGYGSLQVAGADDLLVQPHRVGQAGDALNRARDRRREAHRGRVLVVLHALLAAVVAQRGVEGGGHPGARPAGPDQERRGRRADRQAGVPQVAGDCTARCRGGRVPGVEGALGQPVVVAGAALGVQGVHRAVEPGRVPRPERDLDGHVPAGEGAGLVVGGGRNAVGDRDHRHRSSRRGCGGDGAQRPHCRGHTQPQNRDDAGADGTIRQDHAAPPQQYSEQVSGHEHDQPLREMSMSVTKALPVSGANHRAEP
jgi:hypothetical protein